MKKSYETLLYILIFIGIYCAIMNTGNYIMLHDINKTISKYESTNVVEDNDQEDTIKEDHEIIVKETDNIIYDKDDKYSCLYLKDIKDMLNKDDKLVVYYKDEGNTNYITMLNIKSTKFSINFTNNIINIIDDKDDEYKIVESDDYVSDSDIRALLFYYNDTIFNIDKIEYTSKEDRD